MEDVCEMRLHELKPAPGSRTAPKRVGRGIGSGLGKTSGRGHKGQKARSGGKTRRGFEGGQMPLFQRLPKRGFHNKFGHRWTVVNVGLLDTFDDGSTVNPQLLLDRGMVKTLKDGIKILGDGDLTKKLMVQAQSFSARAVEKIEKAGGRTEVI